MTPYPRRLWVNLYELLLSRFVPKQIYFGGGKGLKPSRLRFAAGAPKAEQLNTHVVHAVIEMQYTEKRYLRTLL